MKTEEKQVMCPLRKFREGRGVSKHFDGKRGVFVDILTKNDYVIMDVPWLWMQPKERRETETYVWIYDFYWSTGGRESERC